MNAISLLKEAQQAYSAQEYGKALSAISRAETEGKACPETLLLKAACIQLAAETDFPVTRALEVYLSLLSERPEDPRALSEAAYFLLNVHNDAARAHDYFVRATDAYSRLLNEAICGLGRTKMELGVSRTDVLGNIRKRFEHLEESVHKVLALS